MSAFGGARMLVPSLLRAALLAFLARAPAGRFRREERREDYHV
jgi:hypothetical protein